MNEDFKEVCAGAKVVQQGLIVVEQQSEEEGGGYLMMFPDGNVEWKANRKAANGRADKWLQANLKERGANVGIATVEWR